MSAPLRLRTTVSVCVLALCMSWFGCKDDPTPVATSSECLRCHGPQGNGGIEDAHPGYPLSCVDCHGGDPSATEHAALPDGIEGALQVRSMTSVELDEVPLDYIQWVNPSDYRVADQTCGGFGCHPTIVANAPTSIMTTFAGHFANPRYSSGTQDERRAIVGVRDQTVPGSGEVEGTVGSLETLDTPPLDENSTIHEFLDQYLETGCPRCHVWNFGPNDVRGDFRSSGCAGCHMVYSDDGLSESDDPTANRDDPPHPLRHQLTAAVPDVQCEHCHYRGNRIGTMYRGIRESGRLGETDNRELSNITLHNREPGFYVLDEDTTNDVDETPPDIHYTAGMGCVDCHVGVDVHGDGQLYSAHDYQVGIECTDCHGTREAAISADEDGVFHTSSGDVLSRVIEGDDGFVLISAFDSERRFPLTQIADLSDQFADNQALAYAHGEDDGFSHLDGMECYTCHTAWTQSCVGCHVTVDMRSEGRSLIDGELAFGRQNGTRSWVTMDYFALGVGVDGQLTPMAPQEKMFVTVILPCDPETETCTEGVDTPNPGRRLFDQQVRRTADGLLGHGFGPVAPHTTSSGSVPCDRCHLREDESNWDIINETLGRPSGRFIIPDGEGTEYDLSQVVDEDGVSIVGLAHPGTDVLPTDVVERMLIPRVEDSGLELRQFPEWEAP